MIVKVCGIKYRENLLDLFNLPVDMVGFNFYPESVRYVDAIPDVRCSVHLIPKTLKKVGVFVNSSIEEILEAVDNYQLDFVQLHGNESSEFTASVAKKIPIIKVFQIDENFEFDTLNAYDICDFFLFDTPTPLYGGSGRKFDWNILEKYSGSTPFLLSGGIGPEDHEEILEVRHSSFVGIDINSKFEDAPALKDLKSVSEFVQNLNKNKRHYE